MSRRYTSVLPLPVMPCSRNVPAVPRPAATAVTAACCPGSSSGPATRSVAPPAERGVSTSALAMKPRASRARAASRQRAGALLELGRRGRAGRQQPEQGALLRRAARLAGGPGRRARGRRQPAFLARRGRRTEAQRPGECGGEHRADRVVVVLRCPAEQLEQRGVEHRARIEDLEDGLQPLGRDLGVRGGGDDQARQALASEGHPHPHSGHDGGPAGLRREVVEQAPQGGIERYPENVGHGS